MTEQGQVTREVDESVAELPLVKSLPEGFAGYLMPVQQRCVAYDLLTPVLGTQVYWPVMMVSLPMEKQSRVM